MADEDASIRRLRRLMGNQSFEADVAKGKVAQEKEAAERAARERIEAEKQEENVKASTMASQTTSTNAVNIEAHENAPASEPSAPIAQKNDRVKPDSCPPPDTGYETDPDTHTWDRNQESSPGMVFCPIYAVNKFPYKYLGNDQVFSESVADAGFNNGQFFSREWTIFYLKPPSILSGNPICFVPESEVKILFKEVSNRVGTEIGFPAAAGFRLEFLANEPRPRYLGISTSREEFDTMVMHRVPTSDNDINGSWSASKHGDDRVFKVWQGKLEAAIAASKQKKGRSKANAQQKRVASKQQWCRQMRRAQRYLGLRGPNEREAKGARTSIQEETNALQADQNGIEDAEQPPELDIEKPSQFPFDQDVVFISLDIEAHETMQAMITEIGISTLDTRDLKGIAPGQMAENWRSPIKYRHFRINEFRHHTNSRFISGCPDRFEKDFGVSEFIPMADIAKVTAATCKPPFPLDAAERAAVEADLDAEPSNVPEARKTVIVGHNFDCDVDWLRRHGFEILKLSGLIEVLDTSMIHRTLVHETNPTTLANVLNMCKIPGWNLHNAGNDAGYTLQVLLAMAVEHLANPEPRRTEEQHAARREEAMKQAAAREDSDFHEWLAADRRGSSRVWTVSE